SSGAATATDGPFEEVLVNVYGWWKIGRGWFAVFAALAVAILAAGLVPPAVPVAADTWTTQSSGKCIDGGNAQYTVPNGTRYVQVVAIGGGGSGGASFNSNNTGGAGGNGAKVTAVLPVTSG